MYRTFLVVVFSLLFSSVLAGELKDDLVKAILFLENQNVKLLEELDLKQKEILHISELAAGGRYLRYEIAGREAFSEVRHISGNLKKGLILCRVETFCEGVCEQRDFACFFLKEKETNLIQIQIPVKLPSAPEKSVAEEDECPTKKRAILPKEEKSETIIFDFYCEKGKEPIFLERKSLSFSEILHSAEKN